MKQITMTALALILCAGTAGAAGSYDGDWEGGGVAAGQKCRLVAQIVMHVRDNKVTGQFTLEKGTPAVQGQVAADGAFTGKVGNLPMDGKFSGKGFEGNYTSASQCQFRLTASHK